MTGQQIIAYPDRRPTLDGQDVQGVLVRSHDGGATWELCYRINDRWQAPVPARVTTEKW